MRNLSSAKLYAKKQLSTPKVRVLLLSVGLVCLLLYSVALDSGPQATAAPGKAIVTGIVIDAHGGKAIPGATVLVRNARVPAAYTGRAGADGRFLIERGGTEGLVQIVAYTYGYGVAVKRYRLEEGEPLQHLLFRLEPAAELRGTVVDRFSAPVAGAKVEIAYARPLTRLSILDLGTSDIRTNEDGTFRIRSIQPRVPFTIVAHDLSTGRSSAAAPVEELLMAGQRRDGVLVTLSERQ